MNSSSSSFGRCFALALMASSVSNANPLDTWQVRSSGTPRRLNDVAYGNGTFVAVGEEGTIRRSAGSSWWPGRTA